MVPPTGEAIASRRSLAGEAIENRRSPALTC